MLAGRYLLSSVLGRGGMAEVWEASDTVLGRRVAIKLFRSDPASEADYQRQQAEIRLLAGLIHPNLVAVFDAGTDLTGPGRPCTYLVMELVEGATLAQLLRLGPVAPAEAAQLGAQVASALAYVHARGIVHRDLKPANILLGSAPEAGGAVPVKLTDFGVARILDGTRLTVTGTTVGTANYLSPEQASGAEVTPASDVYSLGLVLLECLSGEVAYPGHGIEAAIARLHRAPAVPEDLDPSWQGLLAAMTARDPGTRPSAAAVASRLRTLAARHAPAAICAQLPARVEIAKAQARALFSRTGAAPSPAGGGHEHPSLPGDVDWQAPRRRGTGRIVAAAAVLAVALAAVVLALVSRGGSASAGSGSAPPPRYPTVAGKLGGDLRRLQDAVPSDASAPTLRQDVYTLSALAHRGQWVTARAWVAQLQQDVMYAHSAGALSVAQEDRITAVLEAVAADLQARIDASTRPSSSSAAAPSPVAQAAVSAVPRPATSQPPSPLSRPVAVATHVQRVRQQHSVHKRSSGHRHRHSGKHAARKSGHHRGKKAPTAA